MISCSTGLLLPGWLLQNSMVLLEPPPLPDVADVPVPAQADRPAMPAAPARPRKPRRENSFMGECLSLCGVWGSKVGGQVCRCGSSALDRARGQALDHLA